MIDDACSNLNFLDERILKLSELIFHKFIIMNFVNFTSTKYSRNNKLVFKLSQTAQLYQTVTAALLRNCIIAKIETLRRSALFPNEFGFHIDACVPWMRRVFTEKYAYRYAWFFLFCWNYFKIHTASTLIDESTCIRNSIILVQKYSNFYTFSSFLCCLFLNAKV